MKAVFLDIETNGLDPFRHRPIDIALKMIDLSSGAELCRYQSLIAISWEDWERSDPESLAVNGYEWEIVSKGKRAEQVGLEISTLLNGAGLQRGRGVFICQNPAFDHGFFIQIVAIYQQEKYRWPYHWLDLASMYWTKVVQNAQAAKAPLPQALTLSKNSIAEKYQLPREAHPHRAMNGVEHLIACYQAVMKEPS